MNILLKKLLKIIIDIALVIIPVIVFIGMKIEYLCSASGGIYVGLLSILLIIIFEVIFIGFAFVDLFFGSKKKTVLYFYSPLIILTIINILIIIFAHPVSSGSC
ncbi:MAG: hypothetical protein NTW11_03855 [Candidatus Staskawiczbacteria bacterium]|nr:hypothetical protein [Candidatus Staskawiczbacteria bacterium]